jgi:hypothetical protein
MFLYERHLYLFFTTFLCFFLYCLFSELSYYFLFNCSISYFSIPNEFSEIISVSP